MHCRNDKILFETLEVKKSGKKFIEDVHAFKVKAVQEFEKESEIFGWFAIVGVFLILQAVVSAANYSGAATPPVFGDFEAQRHWMEITFHLPIKDWYFNTTDNDLTYWGLDYPPLTAYHSCFLGLISHWINPDWVALGTSHGYESSSHLAFMRLSVITTMVTLYAYVLISIIRLVAPKNKSKIELFLVGAVALLYPGLIFVDNGHFQYNHIALALFLFSAYCFHVQLAVFGSISFVLALNFKQMELYHSLPIFVYLFSRSIVKSQTHGILERLSKTFLNLGKIGLAVILTFLFLWAPFLSDFSVTKQVLHRIFPFSRGLFEDKVANFWCCFNVIYKVKDRFDVATLAKLSTGLVLVSVLPSLFVLFLKPSDKNFRISLTISALSFYLFSFHVHEKTILMAAIPSLLLLFDHFDAVTIFLDASSISMYPLCLKDQNPEILLLFAFYHLAIRIVKDGNSQVIIYIKSFQFAISMAICGLQLFGVPPSRYPYLFDLLNAAFSFAIFAIFWIYLNFILIKSNYFQSSTAEKDAKKKN